MKNKLNRVCPFLSKSVLCIILHNVASAPNPAHGPFLGSRDSFTLNNKLTEPNQYYLEFFMNCFESMVQ